MSNKETIGHWAYDSCPCRSVIFHRNSIVSQYFVVLYHADLPGLSYSEPLWWKKIGKVPNWAKLAEEDFV